MKALHVIPTLLLSAAAHCAIIWGVDSQLDKAMLLGSASTKGTMNIQVVTADITTTEKLVDTRAFTPNSPKNKHTPPDRAFPLEPITVSTPATTPLNSADQTRLPKSLPAVPPTYSPPPTRSIKALDSLSEGQPFKELTPDPSPVHATTDTSMPSDLGSEELKNTPRQASANMPKETEKTEQPPQRPTEAASQNITSDILLEAKVVSQITPQYPIFSRKRGEEGSVKLAIKIDKNGKVVGIDVLRSSGHSRLDKAALNAVSDARFTPARLNNTVVASSKTLSIKFDLNEPY